MAMEGSNLLLSKVNKNKTMEYATIDTDYVAEELLPADFKEQYTSSYRPLRYFISILIMCIHTLFFDGEAIFESGLSVSLPLDLCCVLFRYILK